MQFDNKRQSDTSIDILSTNLNTSSGGGSGGQSIKRQKLNDDESDGEENPNIKFKTLEHHGVTFPPSYKALPEDIKLKWMMSQESIDLCIELEEMVWWFAGIQETEFGQKDKVRENFWLEFNKKMKECQSDLGVDGLDDLDFSQIREYYEKLKEEKKNRPSSEKKQEKEDKDKIAIYYQQCLIDGYNEKVANYGMEPPGLFRGRGEHPHAGRVKSRILPEYVTLNLGWDNVIPHCPVAGHAWKGINSSNEGTWLAKFKDELNNYSDSAKYLFLSADSKLKGDNDKKKYERARRLNKIISKIRGGYMDCMKSAKNEDNQLGVATYLIDTLALRIGNEKGEDEADTVGCCSLRVEHITIDPAEKNKITFDFLGKDSMRYYNTVNVLPIVFTLIKRFKCKPGTHVPKAPEDDLFESINAGQLNDYLKNHMDDLSAKVFRTFNASNKLQEQLEERAKENDFSLDEKPEVKVKFYNDCNREVALLCNHQKAESKGLKEQIERMQDLIDAKKEELRELEQWRTDLKKGTKRAPPQSQITMTSTQMTQMTEAGGEKQKKVAPYPKTVEACDLRIVKLKQVITTKTYDKINKQQNAKVSLTTSKINYMDPRITIAWCKRREVPIEKVFPKTLMSKFAWAMNQEPDWNF